MIYKYKAVTDRGEVIEGNFECQNTDEVLLMLRKNNYSPITIEELSEKSFNVSFALGSTVKTKDLAIFCRLFYVMLNSGISIVNSLDILQKQVENKTLKKTTVEIYEDVQKGLTLSEAMRKHEKIFPTLLINMVESGEASGNLDSIMNRMAIHYEKEFKIENKIKAAFMYPIVLIIVSISVVVFLLIKVMPTFISMFEGSGVELPLPTRMLLNMSGRLKKYWYFYIVSIVGIVLAIKFAKSTSSGKYFFDNLKIKIPVIKKTNIKIITSRFTRTLSTLLTSGVPLIQAMEVVSKVVGNVVVMNELEKANEDIRKGVPLSQTIKETGVFPPMVFSMMSVGEESGSLDEILVKTSDFYDEEVEVAIEKMTTILEPILIVIMAFIIGFIVISIAMPMFDMTSTIK